MNASQQFDGWLCEKARKGDSAAFDKLLDIHATKLRNIASNFITDDLCDRDDYLNVARLAAWEAVHKYRPERGDFGALLSVAVHSALSHDLRYRRTAARWAGRGAHVSLSTGGADGTEMQLAAPSWCFGANPLTVVLYRDDLRRAWLNIKTANREALQAYLSRVEGEPLTPALKQKLGHARKAAHAILQSPDGVADCTSRRSCARCGERLAPAMRADAMHCSRSCGQAAADKVLSEQRWAERMATIA